MIEKLKKVKQVSFSNSPKAKIIVGTAVLAVGIITSVTVANMRKTVVLSIDGEEETFVTYKGTVKDVLQQKGVELALKDKVQPLLESKVSENEFIKLKRAIPVEITANGTRLTIETAEDTVGDMLDKELVTLNEQGIEFDKDVDETSVSLESKIDEWLNIQIVKVETKEVVEREAINFDTIVENNEDLDSSV